jgi:hypothetical protein
VKIFLSFLLLSSAGSLLGHYFIHFLPEFCDSCGLIFGFFGGFAIWFSYWFYTLMG